ncbi:DUF3311 domain-containing protein [Actinomadura sp. 6N118]|uniref:DUF3311 domain-containing protein n=1 Tax=Actinomadura sp. 6N118 TaxID=3375151 RepID=UPI0037BD1FD3
MAKPTRPARRGPKPDRPARRRWPARQVAAGVCLAVPVVALVCMPWYAHHVPSVAGVRSFYWYQFAWVPGSVVFMVAAYLLRGPRDRPPREHTKRHRPR